MPEDILDAQEDVETSPDSSPEMNNELEEQNTESELEQTHSEESDSENMIPQSRFKEAVEKEVAKRLVGRKEGKEDGKEEGKKKSQTEPTESKGFDKVDVLNFRLDTGLSAEQAEIVKDYAKLKGLSLYKAYESDLVKGLVEKEKKTERLQKASLGASGRSATQTPRKSGGILRKPTSVTEWYKPKES